MTNSELEKRLKRLERRVCCIDKEVQFFDTVGDFPAEGVVNNIYVDNSTGAIYIWDGANYISTETDNSSNFLARQSFEPYNTNPPIPLLEDTVQFERYIDAKYLHIPGSTEHRMYFLSIASLVGIPDYRYASSLDGGKTWDFDGNQAPFFTALGSGDEITLHEFFILPLDANNWNMYYQALDGSSVGRTRLATTTDAGATWVRQGTVLNVGGVGEWDENYAGVRNVIKLPDGSYYMAYEGRTPGGLMKAGAATSPDGLTWTKIGQVFEMEPGTYSWEGNAGLLNYVQYIDGVYVMMYGTKQLSAGVQNTNRYIGIAYSNDGINYTKYTENPIINLSDYLVDTPGSWNYGTEDFVAWDKVPGKEGAYTIITRARPVYVSGPMNWNFGLYWFGNRINSDDILDATLSGTDLSLVKRLGENIIVDLSPMLDTNVEKVWYINPNGDNLTAEVGNFFKQAGEPIYVAKNLATDGDTFQVSRGTYTAGVSVPFDNANYLNHSLAFKNDTVINADANTLFTVAADSNQTMWFANDAIQFGNVPNARSFSLLGRPNIIATRSSTALVLMIGFYHANGNINLELGNVSYLGGGRNWFMQTGCDDVDLHIDDYKTSGSVAFWFTDSVGGATVKKNINVSILNALAQGRSDGANGLIRMNNAVSATGNFTYNIGNFLADGTYGNVHMFGCSANLLSSAVNYNIDNYVQVAVLGLYNGYAGGSANSAAGCMMFSSATFTNSVLNINANYISSSNTFFATYVSENTVLTNSVVNIHIKKANWAQSASFIIRNMTLNNNSKVIIHCEECICSANQAAFWIYDNVIDATSSIEIKGTYKTGASAVINTRNKIILDDCTLINDGTVAAIASDLAVSIVVKKAFANSLLTDVDVTETVGTVTRDALVI